METEMKFNRADFFLAISMLACGFLYWNLVQMSNMGVGVLAFTIVLYSVTFSYLKVRKIQQTKSGIVVLVLSAISAVQFALFDGNLIKTLNLIFLSICFIYWVAVNTKNCLGKGLSIYSIWDVVNHTLVEPFANITCEYYGLKQGISKNKHSRNIVYVVVGIVLFLPLMVFVVGQLSSADLIFKIILDSFIDAISVGNFVVYGLQFVIGIPVACYLFGLIYGNVERRNISKMTKENLDNRIKEIKFVPKITVYTVLTVFNIIYIIFFASQVAYFLSAFEHILPDNFTYAEYARNGFFQLCKVATINMILIILANIFIANKSEPLQPDKETQSPKMLKIQTAFISVMTIGLIATALSKMYMYIQSYGLTQLRVYTSWFMFMLLFAFLVILARQVKLFNGTKIMVIGSIVGFMLLSYGNVDGNIAKYNISSFEDGKMESLDYKMLCQLSDGAVPYLYEFYKKTDDKEAINIIYNYIAYGHEPNEDGSSSGEYTNDEETDSNMKTIKTNNEYKLKKFNIQSNRASSISGLLQSEGMRKNV